MELKTDATRAFPVFFVYNQMLNVTRFPCCDPLKFEKHLRSKKINSIS